MKDNKLFKISIAEIAVGAVLELLAANSGLLRPVLRSKTAAMRS